MAKRQTGGRIKDANGYLQKSAEVIVGQQRTATAASVKAIGITKTRRAEC